MRFSSYVGKVIGPNSTLEATELGVVLPHEHILAGWEDGVANLNDPDLAASEVSAFATNSFRSGPKTIIEVSSRGLRWESGNSGVPCATPGWGGLHPSYPVTPPYDGWISADFPWMLVSIADAINTAYPEAGPFHVI